MKLYREGGSTVPLILNFGSRCRWMVSLMIQLLCSRGEPRSPLNWRLDGPLEPVSTSWGRGKSLVPTGIQTPERLLRSLVTRLTIYFFVVKGPATFVHFYIRIFVFSIEAQFLYIVLPHRMGLRHASPVYNDANLFYGFRVTAATIYFLCFRIKMRCALMR